MNERVIESAGRHYLAQGFEPWVDDPIQKNLITHPHLIKQQRLFDEVGLVKKIYVIHIPYQNSKSWAK